MQIRTILITGGAGFIGSNIVAGLVARNTHRIVVCDTLGNGDKWRNLRNHSIYEIVLPNRLFGWLEIQGASVDAIVHMGAISSTTETDADLFMETNQTLTNTLYHWCAKHAKRFIYASSAATYGDGTQGFDDDCSLSALNLLRPLNPYGWSKHITDRHIAISIAQGDPTPPQWVGLKFFNVYGPNEYHKNDQRSVVCVKFADAHAGKPVKLFKSYRSGIPDGGQRRDFIYVKDCVRVVSWLLDHPNVSGVYNVGTGKARGFDDLVNALFRALGRPPRIEYMEMPETLQGKYQYFTEAQMDRLRTAGYSEPFTSLEEGVREYVQDYLLKEDPYL